MTIDIIAAAQADRSRLEIARAKIEEHERQIELLHSEILQHEGDKISLEMWVDMYHELGGDDDALPFLDEPEPASPEAKETGADSALQPDIPASRLRDEIPTIPPQEGEETVTVPEIDPAPVKEKTKKQIILEALEQHPDWWAEKIASETGIGLSTVRGYASQFKMKLPPRPVGPSEATKALLAAEKPQEARKSAPAPKAQPEPKPHPVPAAPAPRHISTKPMAEQRSGTMFRLRNAEGLYLHCDLSAMLKKGLQFTTKSQYPWQGTERQLLAVRKMLPQTIDLREEVIQ